MTAFTFCNSVQEILESCGWSPQRHINVTPWVTQLESEGFVVLSQAIPILESFGGLRISSRRSADSVYTPEDIVFDPLLGASGERVWIAQCEKKIDLTLTPIAWIGGGAALLLGQNGYVYSAWVRTLWVDGTSFKDAMEQTLITAKRKPVEIATLEES